MESIYSLLGLPDTASPEVVKKSYRAMVRRYHPDRLAASGGHSSTDDNFFKKLNRFYDDFDRVVCEARGARDGFRAADAAGNSWGQRDASGVSGGIGDVEGVNRREVEAARSLFRALNLGGLEARKSLANVVLDKIDFGLIGTQEHFQFVFDELEKLDTKKFYLKAVAFMGRAIQAEEPLSGRYAGILAGYVTEAQEKGLKDPDELMKARWLRREIGIYVSEQRMREPSMDVLHKAVKGGSYVPPTVVERGLGVVRYAVGGVRRFVQAGMH